MADGNLTGVLGFSLTGKDVPVAFELSRETEDAKYRMEAGMSLLYTGNIRRIDGRPCRVFALGTKHGDAFGQRDLCLRHGKGDMEYPRYGSKLRITRLNIFSC